MGNPSQSYVASLVIYMGSHSVTCHPTQVNAPRLSPARPAGTRLTYPGGMEGWVDLGSLIAAWPGIEPTAAYRKSVALTVTPPSHPPLLWTRHGWNGYILLQRRQWRGMNGIGCKILTVGFPITSPFISCVARDLLSETDVDNNNGRVLIVQTVPKDNTADGW